MMPETFQKMQELQKKRQRKFVTILIVIAIAMAIAMYFSQESHQKLMWGENYVVEEVEK